MIAYKLSLPIKPGKGLKRYKDIIRLKIINIFLFLLFTNTTKKSRMTYIPKSFLNLLLSLLLISGVNAQNNFFNDVPEASVRQTAQQRVIIPSKYRTLRLDSTFLLSFLKLLPSEEKIANKNMAPVIAIPMPDGTTASFRIWESLVMEPGLSKAQPKLMTFTGQGIDDPTATIKLDWTMYGFHAMILSAVTGAVFMDPYDRQTLTNYISYYKRDYSKTEPFAESGPIKMNQKARPAGVLAGTCVGAVLRTYRLAVACTYQYAKAATGLARPSKAQVLAKIVTSVNRVNGVYEKELSIRMVLVANDTNVIFTSLTTDPFTGNDNASTLIAESQQNIDAGIGDANYDIGHTFSTGGGGLAGLGVVCISGQKASGITGSSIPVGDPYDIDYVAHEMGHQFGANHTFNTEQGNCGGNGVQGFNAEPGSGSTIMAYAGICAPENLQNNSDPQFHTISFDEIVAYSNSSSGNTCAVKTSTGNTAPVVNAGAAYTIPVSTPFVLTGSATDINGDALTYSWEQVDVGGPFGVWNAPSGDAPLFRSFSPTTAAFRHFPKLSSQIANTNVIGEILPNYSRTMHFRLTARDNKAGGGGVCYAETTVSSSAAGGPFVVTSPNTSGIVWFVNDFQTVTWNPGGTAAAPVNCANVSIQLSTDGGLTFPVTILASTPNDGAEEIQVPNNVSNNVRIRVMAVGNIFYDFSDNNLSIQTSPTATFSFNNPATVAACAASSGTATLKTAALSGFTTTIALSASLNPAGTTVTFGASSIAPGSSTTVTLNNTNSLTAGSYTIKITGVAGAITKTRDLVFIVGGGPIAPASLTTPANDSIGLPVRPSFNWSAVSGATSFVLELSKTNDFAVIYQTISNINPPYTLTSSLGEDSVYFWRVKSANLCGTGAASATPNRFKTGINSCRISKDVPKTINAVGTAVVTSNLIIPASLGVVITDVNVVGLVGTHTYIQDLTFTLKSPAGTSIVLFDTICGQHANFNLNLDDQAATATFPCPPIGGVTIIPQSALAAFNGQNSTGTWTLTVTDAFDGDGGQLSGWGLSINTNSINCTVTPTPLPSQTTYTFTGNGNWNLAANWSNNTIPPAILPAGSAIVINHTAGGNCQLNISQRISTGATLTVLTGKNLVVQGALTIQ